MILHKVEVKPLEIVSDTMNVEHPDGLRWAVVFRGSEIVALFGSEYWAKRFIDKCPNDGGCDTGLWTIREVAE